MSQIILFFEGVDKSGKTSIAISLSKLLNIPYFKNPQETMAFQKNYEDALHYEATIMYEFLKQTNYSIIRDREFISEYVYSKVYKRKSNYFFIWDLDYKYSKINTKIIYCYKDIYKNFKDTYVKEENIKKLKEKYDEYFLHTKIKFLKLNTTNENLEEQIYKILLFIGDNK